jgi:SAM-dependent methyltransferase
MAAGRKGDYGIDAPAVPILFAVFVVAGVAAAVVGARLGIPAVVTAGAITATICAVSGACFVYATRIGKHVMWQRLLDELALGGDEVVLDVGCGRGAVLVQAAARVPRGKAIGIDIWQARDQSGNAEAVTRRNAELEGVSARVELVTADMRAIPLPDASVDVVVSSLAIHNIRSADERGKALGEIVRVLRPGGRFVVVDISHSHAYADELARRGMTAARRGLGPRMWYGGPHFAAGAVVGRKPA